MSRNHSPAKIKEMVQETGSSLNDLAESSDYSQPALSACLRRRMQGPHQVIASHLGKSLHDLWPEWYDTKDNPVPAQKRIPKRPLRGSAKNPLKTDGEAA